MEKYKIVCVGTGMAAYAFVDAFLKSHPQAASDILILEKAKGVGGRIATRRFDSGVIWNMGPTALEYESEDLRNILKSVYLGVSEMETSEVKDAQGNSSYRTACKNINSIMKALWSNRGQISRQSRVVAVESIVGQGNTSLYRVSYEKDGTTLNILCEWLVINAPIPQAREWNWINVSLPKFLNQVEYDSQTVNFSGENKPSGLEGETASDRFIQTWKYATVKRAQPGFFALSEGIGFIGDGFECEKIPTLSNGVERAFLSGRALAQELASLIARV